MTPSQWKVSTLICAIISLRWHGEADAFPENWKISRRFLLFLFRPTTVSDYRKTSILIPTVDIVSLFSRLVFFYPIHHIGFVYSQYLSYSTSADSAVVHFDCQFSGFFRIRMPFRVYCVIYHGEPKAAADRGTYCKPEQIIQDNPEDG